MKDNDFNSHGTERVLESENKGKEKQRRKKLKQIT